MRNDKTTTAHAGPNLCLKPEALDIIIIYICRYLLFFRLLELLYLTHLS